MFDPARPPSTPLAAATVILMRARDGTGELEVFLLRRHRRSTFMSNAFVFPGGKAEPEDGSPEVTAIRELYEEAGVLLVEERVDDERRIEWRKRLGEGESFARLVERERLTPALGRLHYWARWITPSVEPKRFDARFFLAEAPPDQAPAFDDQETVEQVWLTPAEAIARHAGEGLRLPPPQLKTMTELFECGAGGAGAEAGAGAGGEAGAGLAGCIAESRRRAEHPHPIMPRFSQVGDAVSLLLPWDPDYETRGVGEGVAMRAGHPLAVGPSRFVLEGMSWRLC